ncbi:MAG: hypothetical protein ACLRIS_17475 [Flavonifractor plautii]
MDKPFPQEDELKESPPAWMTILLNMDKRESEIGWRCGDEVTAPPAVLTANAERVRNV